MARQSEAHIAAAHRLLTQERVTQGPASERAAAAGRVFDTVLQSLAPIVGEAGVRALFARSVKLARPQFPCLEQMTPGTWASNSQIAEQLVDCLNELESAALSEVTNHLLAVFFGLMTTFIGEHLVWQVMTKAFPGIGEPFWRRLSDE
ncbi:MAG TPA: hypothetical protein VI072_29500 [Polyangiaceae bacterium]